MKKSFAVRRNRFPKKHGRLQVYKQVLCAVLLFVTFMIWTVPISATDYSLPVDLGDIAAPEVSCRSAILMEETSGAVLYEKNADEALPPASVTKVMTLLLVMEAIESGKVAYTDTVSASANACSMGGSQIYLEEGEEMSVKDLLKSVIIASANDAAVALAEHISGSEEAFVAQMNKKAEALGMKSTFFENTNGLDDTVQKHLTSARDIAIMSRELIKYPKITEYSSIWMDSIRSGEFGLTNTNRLIRFYKGATGLKTGSTSKAGFCVSATAKRGDVSLICVIMGAESRDIRNAEAARLLDFGFANYGVFTAQAQSFENVPVIKGVKAIVKCESAPFSCIASKGEISKIVTEISMPQALDAPVQKGSVVGEIIFKSGERELGRSKIIVCETVEKMTFFVAIHTLFSKCAEII